jgi:hypothetical protein
MQNINTEPGNVMINQGNQDYMAERSFGEYYFLLKAKRALQCDFRDLYTRYKSNIGFNNNNISFPSRYIYLHPLAISYSQLSGNYVSYNDFLRLNDFIIRVEEVNLLNSMVCWPLRQGQNAGSDIGTRITSPTVYSIGGLPQASAVRIGTIEENINGVVSSNTLGSASGRIITSNRKLSGYSQRTFYAAANISNYNFNRRARLMYTTLAEPTFIEFAGPDINGMMLEGYDFGSQIANTTSIVVSGNLATASPISKPAFNTFNTFSSIYNLS